MTSAPSLKEAYRLVNEAKGHKRVYRQERRLAAEKLEKARAICEKLGIQFEYVKGVAKQHGQETDPNTQHPIP